MYGVPGWQWRENELKDDKRWKRTMVTMKNGEEEVRETGKIPLLENFPLGLEERGVEMNHSGQVRSAAFLENVTA
jgi:hypothetical protein